MATRDERFRQAAWAYVGYGVVYWLGGLALMGAGLGPGGPAQGRAAWFVVGALFIVLVPWLLIRERPWFDRWMLSRRDFARILSVLVAVRAVEMGRVAWSPRYELIQVLGLPVPFQAGAWVFFILTVATVVLLARAAWSRP